MEAAESLNKLEGKETVMGTKKSDLTDKSNLKVALGIALIFIGLYLLTQTQQFRILSVPSPFFGILFIIAGVLLAGRYL